MRREGLQARREDEQVVIENKYLRLNINQRGGRVFEFFDKIRGVECAKTYSKGDHGVNEVRLKGIFDEPEHLDPMNEGIHTLEILDSSTAMTCVAKIKSYANSADGPQPVLYTKKYTIHPEASRVDVTFSAENLGKNNICLAPWLSQMLAGDSAGHPKVGFMTELGIYQSEHPIPGRDGLTWSDIGKTVSAISADNWMYRSTTNPATANTFAIVSERPLFKAMSWRKPEERFITLETIFAPSTILPGNKCVYNYALTLTLPADTLAYCSKRLNIGISPHPADLNVDSEFLSLTLIPVEPTSSAEIALEWLELETNSIVAAEKAKIPAASPNTPITFKTRIPRHSKGLFQLILEIKFCDFRERIVIPVIPGRYEADKNIFPAKFDADKIFTQIPETTIPAPKICDDEHIEIFALPQNERCFKNCRIIDSKQPTSPLRIFPGSTATFYLAIKSNANIARKCLLRPLPVCSRKNANSAEIPGTAYATLSARTTIPSLYNPKYPVGEYPEALLPNSPTLLIPNETSQMIVAYQIPETAAPGAYKATIEVELKERIFDFILEWDVLPITMPIAPSFAISCDIKKIPDDTLILDDSGTPISTDQIRKEVENLYLRYKLTPPGLAIDALFAEEWEQFEVKFNKWLTKGATSVWLGVIPEILNEHGDEKVKRISEYLEHSNLAGRFFVRTGLDELSTDNIPQLIELCDRWKTISSIPIMETYYHQKDERLFGKLDIYCRFLSEEPWIKERIAAGDRFWQVNPILPLEEAPWKSRLLFWRYFHFGYTGSYLWTAKNWVSINKWGEDWWSDSGAENLSATLIWHHPKGLLSTLRLEALRDGIEDFTLFSLLKTKIHELTSIKHAIDADLSQNLKKAISFFEGPPLWTRPESGDELVQIRNIAAEILASLN
jgi:hypothetical protein